MGTQFRFKRPTFDTSTQMQMSRNAPRKTATLDFPSIAAGANATLTITVRGAKVGDHVTVCAASAAGPAAGLILQAYVTANDTVTVRAVNHTGAAVDAASAAYSVQLHKA